MLNDPKLEELVRSELGMEVRRAPMNLNERAEQAYEDSARWFPSIEHDIANTLLCVAGEVGETANIVKKVVRGSTTYAEQCTLLCEEVVDIQTYLFKLMGQLQVHAKEHSLTTINWDKAYDEKRKFNERRFGQTEALTSVEADLYGGPMYTQEELDAKTAEAISD